MEDHLFCFKESSDMLLQLLYVSVSMIADEM
jgi:hypothetical protein